jgi:hypothetical protein
MARNLSVTHRQSMTKKMRRFPVFTSRWSVGLTFVSWSYHWLLGHDTSWHYKLGFCDLPSQPLTSINAHYFKKNHLHGYQEWQSFIMDDKNNLVNCSMYGVGPSADYVGDKDQNYADCLKFASEHAPLIWCVESINDPWYFLSNRQIIPERSQTISQHDIDVYQISGTRDFLNGYFANSLRRFDNNIWDLRELIALNFEHFKYDRNYLAKIDRSIQHLYIDSKDLWYNGEQCIHRIFQYLDLSVQQERLDHWRTVYRKWQLIQNKILQFGWYLPAVIDSIINNYDFDLKFLDLSLVQEAVIQGHLIKDHDLNLRCYGLQKFPNNTKDLHALLEANSHTC